MPSQPMSSIRKVKHHVPTQFLSANVLGQNSYVLGGLMRLPTELNIEYMEVQHMQYQKTEGNYGHQTDHQMKREAQIARPLLPRLQLEFLIQWCIKQCCEYRAFN
jgi:hypothetical protein